MKNAREKEADDRKYGSFCRAENEIFYVVNYRTRSVIKNGKNRKTVSGR